MPFGPADFLRVARDLETQLRTRIVGQDDLIRTTLIALFAGGHVLLEGVPGLGKTQLVRAIGETLDLRFARIQFTPDLMPADITGTTVIQEAADGMRRFEFQPGPVFSNVVLADEINRATPRTQSALLEAMQEHTVTSGTHTRPLPAPFFVLATQNPIELEGTYPLPEAQLDRFLVKLLVPFPDEETLVTIAKLTTADAPPSLTQVANADAVIDMCALVREVPIADHVIDYAVRLVTATHPDRTTSDQIRRCVRFGASPRGVQALVLAAKARALLDGRFNVAFDDIREVAPAALRHRIFRSFEAEAAGTTTDDLIAHLMDSVAAETVAA